ncbi:putative phosphotransferase [Actinoplanes missouriensis 431]|uniref:Putative phosphotransferase n=1 Tax=Actinoplanes missouriensis (strain ATCC 14538 / DSM 43046 / CBS 188.64 / JCM 3121 / NBRC 102363 / NCIMB 12654 / NRRL B-3342 / UNCC 431) TaxID=512565 RepID=I0HB21_ACTM4|nr:aminoglycoside phosphotransferase family protein [Actinoplanes missouriensis]BAL90208.1 putative phosphotransferase [Actinoplanes missouriensis 431]
MNASPMPAAEVDVTLDVVRRLVREQMPDLAGRHLRMLAHGWDNVMVSIGDDLVARLPRRAVAVELLLHEQRWLPDLAPRLPLPIPVPVRVGRPGHGYPWPWSLVSHLPGDIAARTPPADHGHSAVTLARFLAALHVPAPLTAPRNPVRGVPLHRRAAALAENVDRLGTTVDGHLVTRMFRAAVTAVTWARPPVWLHGDLHPANILVDGGLLSAVIDFGDITAGDPATDLAVCWMLLPPDSHRTFVSAYAAASRHPADEGLWIRARAWALVLSTALLARSADNPQMAAIGRRTLDAVLDSDS